MAMFTKSTTNGHPRFGSRGTRRQSKLEATGKAISLERLELLLAKGKRAGRGDSGARPAPGGR